MSSSTSGITGPFTNLYDVFVDWEGRLEREMPGLEARLAEVEARRVLDVGCGTGRHVQALRAAGFDALGADCSDDMLAQAVALLGGDEHLYNWRLGDDPPERLVERGPFDAITALGSTWPQILDEEDARHATHSFQQLLRPGGLVVLGLKAFAVRRGRDPYLPLLRRQHEGRPLWFVRFLDFDDEDEDIAGFHMVVVGGAGECLIHTSSRVRAWGPEELVAWFRSEGFAAVSMSGRMNDPGSAVTGEDVFLSALRP